MGTAPVFRTRAWTTVAQANQASTEQMSSTTSSGVGNQSSGRNCPRTCHPTWVSTSSVGHSNNHTSNLRGRCDICCTRLSLFGRKRTCLECGSIVCPSCLEGSETTLAGIPPVRPLCRRCHLLSKVPQDREHIMNMHVRDLRTILSALGIPSHTCCEKVELVELVLQASRSNDTNEDAGIATSETAQQLNQSVPGLEGLNQDFIQNLDNNIVHVQPVDEAGGSENTSSVTDHAFEAIDLNDIHEEADEGPSLDEPVQHVAAEIPMLADRNWLMLNDIQSEEHIEQLGVQQLKGLLLRSLVDYRGCCEKWELVVKTKRLWRENGENLSKLRDDDICRICMDAPIDCVLLECGHMATCTKCGRMMNECPICRQYVVRAVRIFRA